MRASVWVWSRARWFSRNASAIRASASSSAHAARLTAAGFTRSKWSYTSSCTATIPQTTGTAMISQSWIAIFFRAGCQAATATSSAEAGQAMSSSVPCTYWSFALCTR